MSEATYSSLRKVKRRIFEILEGEVIDRASRTCEIFIAGLVVANVVAIILESVHSIHEAYEAYFHIFDLFSVMVFSLEYVLRVWSYSEKHTGPGDSPSRQKKILFLRPCFCFSSAACCFPR